MSKSARRPVATIKELPELPRYKLDENEQIVIDDLIEEKVQEEKLEPIEDPMPAREDGEQDENK